jgi:Tfp pilus assembly protein PilO
MAVVVVVLSAGAYALGIAPMLATASEAERVRDAVLAADAQQRAVQGEVRERRAQRDALSTALDASVQLAPQDEINARRGIIAELAADAGLTVAETRPMPVERGRRFDLAPIELAGAGDATQFAAFASALRARVPDTAIRSFELSREVERGEPRFTVRLVWHTLPAGVTGRGPDAPSGPSQPGGGAERASGADRADGAGAAGRADVAGSDDRAVGSGA